MISKDRKLDPDTAEAVVSERKPDSDTEEARVRTVVSGLSMDELHDLRTAIRVLPAENAAFSDAILLAAITACGYATACVYEICVAGYYRLPWAAVSIGIGSISVAVVIYVLLFGLDFAIGEVLACAVKSPVRRAVWSILLNMAVFDAVVIWLATLTGWQMVTNVAVVVVSMVFIARRVHRDASARYSGDPLTTTRSNTMWLIGVARSPFRQAILRTDRQLVGWLLQSLMALVLGSAWGHHAAAARSSFLCLEDSGRTWVVLASDQENYWIAPWNGEKNTINREYRKISQVGITLKPMAVSDVRQPDEN